MRDGEKGAEMTLALVDQVRSSKMSRQTRITIKLGSGGSFSTLIKDKIKGHHEALGSLQNFKKSQDKADTFIG